MSETKLQSFVRIVRPTDLDTHRLQEACAALVNSYRDDFDHLLQKLFTPKTDTETIVGNALRAKLMLDDIANLRGIEMKTLREHYYAIKEEYTLALETAVSDSELSRGSELAKLGAQLASLHAKSVARARAIKSALEDQQASDTTIGSHEPVHGAGLTLGDSDYDLPVPGDNEHAG